MSEINAAWTQVWREVETLGFTSRRLATCQVYRGFVSGCYGYQWFGDRTGGKECGDIILPMFSLCHWSDYFLGRKKVAVKDVLRHEYGHAYADVNRRRIETRRFEKAFGWPHEWWPGHWIEYDPWHHVTAYAATSPAEDFAEVFWLYLKHRGRLPRRYDTDPIRRKWKFVGSLRKGRG